ncbi:N-glycosylation protein EOS1 [Spathaspora sp. JA1]|nr:N-glycosylation protein EOS1 [Spathaspora sp. JA1]
MSLMDSLRNRFSDTLEANQIDDDYSVPIRSSSSTALASGVASTQSDQNATEIRQFDPNEVVPSYETSQRIYRTTNAASGIFTPIPSLPIPLAVSNSNSSTSSLNSNTTHTHTNHHPQSQAPPSLKQLGLKFLNARQHFALALCRDISLIPALISLYQSWKRMFIHESLLTSARGLEHFLAGLWCIVASYLSYSVLDGLIVRWIVIYSTPAAIVRVLSMSAIIIAVEFYLVSAFSAQGYKYGLHIWILISCILTFAYIIQNFFTSNLELRRSGTGGGNSASSNANGGRSSESTEGGSNERRKERRRFFDFYNIVVFAVVPVGLASFVTMIGLLRSLLILRIDIETLGRDTAARGI